MLPLLLALVPISLVVGYLRIRRATERFAARLGSSVGGILYVTFGNAAN